MTFIKATNDREKGTNNELDDIKMRTKLEYLELVAKHEPELNGVAEKRTPDNLWRQIKAITKNVRFWRICQKRVPEKSGAGIEYYKDEAQRFYRLMGKEPKMKDGFKHFHVLELLEKDDAWKEVANVPE